MKKKKKLHFNESLENWKSNVNKCKMKLTKLIYDYWNKIAKFQTKIKAQKSFFSPGRKAKRK